MINICIIIINTLVPLVFGAVQNSDDDVSQFDTKFTRQIPIDSPDDATLSESCNMIFQVRFQFAAGVQDKQFPLFFNSSRDSRMSRHPFWRKCPVHGHPMRVRHVDRVTLGILCVPKM